MFLKSAEMTKISGEQFAKLSKKELKWYCYMHEFLQNIELIPKENSTVITNFKSQSNLTRTNFSFEIIVSTDKTDAPIKVSGSIIENKATLNLIANFSVDSKPNNDSHKLTYHTTVFYREDQINDYISLIESSFIHLKSIYIINNPSIIQIKTTPSTLEKIKVPIETDLYQLYKDKKIDNLTFCNFALTQAETNFKTSFINPKVKILNPKLKK